MDWKIKVRSLMKARKLTRNDLMRPFGVTTPGAVGHYLCGRREPSIDQLKSVAKYLKIDISELVDENQSNQDQSKLNQNQIEIISIFRNLTNAQQKIIINQAKTIQSENLAIIAEIQMDYKN